MFPATSQPPFPVIVRVPTCRDCGEAYPARWPRVFCCFPHLLLLDGDKSAPCEHFIPRVSHASRNR